MSVLKYYDETTSTWVPVLAGAVGATGPQGATGPVGGTYIHTQSTPATVWTVTHNLNERYVNVEPIDSTNKSFVGRYDYPQINFLDDSQLTLTFNTAQSGYAAISYGGMGATGPSLPYKTTSSTSMQIVTSPVSAEDVVALNTYRIYFTGTTNWVAMGAPDNNIGTIFTATGSGTGTGSAQLEQQPTVGLSLAYTTGQNIIASYDVNNFMTGIVNEYD